MKKLLFYIIITFTISVSIGTLTPKATTAASNFARITNFSEFPEGVRHWSILRHTLKIIISQQSNGVKQIIIEAPDNIILRDNIDVSNKSGEKINTSVAIINDKKAVLKFPEPVAPGTRLTIEMNKVKKLRATRGEMLYKVFANFVGSDRAIPVGIARLRHN